MIAAIVVVLLVVAAGSAAALYYILGQDDDDEGGGGFDTSSELGEHLMEAGEAIQNSANGFTTSDWDEAESEAMRAKRELQAANQAFRDEPDMVPEDVQDSFGAALVLYRDMAQAMIDAARLLRAEVEVEASYVATSDPSYLPELELFANGFDREGDVWEDLADRLRHIVEDDPDAAEFLELDPSVADGLQIVADVFRAGANLLRQTVLAAQQDEGYESFYEEEIPQEETIHPDSQYFTPEVRALYDAYDLDGSGTIDLNEAERFYLWVEENIQYRYDDENKRDTIPGYPVGDGRPGPEFHQTPAETLAERMGDCEDMNNLEVGFYTYWGITSYQAFVNAQSEGYYDHSIALVYVGADATEAQDIIGRLDYYPMNDNNQWGMPAGAYMIVDNAYSNAFGYIDGAGIEPGQFDIFEVHPLGGAFIVRID